MFTQYGKHSVREHRFPDKFCKKGVMDWYPRQPKIVTYPTKLQTKDLWLVMWWTCVKLDLTGDLTIRTKHWNVKTSAPVHVNIYTVWLVNVLDWVMEIRNTYTRFPVGSVSVQGGASAGIISWASTTSGYNTVHGIHIYRDGTSSEAQDGSWHRLVHGVKGHKCV